MSKIKKTLALLTTVVILVSLLAGCTGTAKPEGNSTGATTATTTAAATEGWKYTAGGPVSEKPVDVTFLTHTGHAKSLAVPNNELPVYAAIQKRLGVTFDWQLLEKEKFVELVTVRLMSKDLPDMVVLLPEQKQYISKLVKDGFFYSYDDLGYKENAPYAQELFKQQDYAHLEKVYRSLYEDKEIYAFGNTVIPRFMFQNWIVNTKWLEKLGMKEPTTIDELIDMLRAFRDKDPNGNGKKDEIPLLEPGFAGNLGLLAKYLSPLAQNLSLDMEFGWSLDSNGKIVYEYTTDKFKEYLKISKLLYDEGLVNKEKLDLTAIYEVIAQDRAGSISFYATFSRVFTSYSPYSEGKEANMVFREILPLINKYTGKSQKYARLDNGTDEGTYILKTAKNPEVCLRIADWLWASEDYDVLRAFGIEGDSYKKEGDKFIRTQPDDYKGTMAYVTYVGGGQPPWTNRQQEKTWRTVNPEWAVKRADEIKPLYVDPLVPFVFNLEETTEIQKYATDVFTYRDEMAASFIEGRVSLDKYDDYVKKLHEIGLTQLTEIYQKNYDRNNK